jgi:glycosyltransferase involved in cell wall biosynthesis
VILPPGDPGKLAQALERVLQDAALAQRLAHAGRAAALEKFSWPVAGDRYRGLLRELIRGAEGNPG